MPETCCKYESTCNFLVFNAIVREIFFGAVGEDSDRQRSTLLAVTGLQFLGFQHHCSRIITSVEKGQIQIWFQIKTGMDPNVSQIRNGNTNEKGKNVMWRNEMDRCLTKTLAEQVKKGNKIDKNLTSSAYTAAVSALNKNFGLDLTKEHIRNRLKTLKKQYGILKDLLSQNGFEWDEKRKMVIANDSVWNDYIKVHPDARAFRARFIEYYNELCIILGNDYVPVTYYRTNVDVVDLSADNEGIVATDTSHIHSSKTKDKGKYIVWTDEMDHCLSKILVEEAKKQGNIKDQNLRHMAYEVALMALNEKFALDLTKDHIRNRLKTWKKQYGVLKELLSHSEFKWDETRKMVFASDSAWNDYIKIHPDAKAFRARHIGNYNELCIIMGNEQAVESCSKPNEEVDMDFATDYEGIETVDASQTHSEDAKEKGRYLVWTNEMDRCLAVTLADQVKQGNKRHKVLKHAAYMAAVRALNERFALDLTKDHVRNRLKTWKKQYAVLKELLSQSGFHWNETQKMVVANDSVWNDYIKAHPDARYLRARSVENYDELCIIFGNGQANGNYSRDISKVDVGLSPDSDDLEIPDRCLSADDDVSNDNIDEGMEVSSQQTRARPDLLSRSKRPVKRKRTVDMMVETMNAMATNIGRIADALEQSSKTVGLDELFELVKKIPGFGDDLVIEACEFLAFDERRAKLFLKLDERLRKIWLLKRLRG
ncbi:PREDICTED: uncharacterized protein LOC104590478 [Nelumbo nucifera]|uniref:Uncharacterized protein LOC104590478 n=2 Tax=Nelumbo nucifera TaxID=4432 RepID=A0A1U7Z8V3_NELNU|nr:PREDICTED: uncharacterized protein LOC104590478 [Nelumbo nucifera]XP_010247463.1 PREDICTED: uncharacterized protein LOC104590478 [Nelumbo nucifera]DAD29243.1 TPA_asm: hypothetical protein HUJ06_030711 [Nelumbo nucifera]